ncbi:hypothetical protein CAPTEDRAFT_189717 [Capitella teleta]|uniref:RRM domain-containing protein n=1 Tax=Capitella teleta TaxID=283909 RepID=R7TGR0_CAPTE|nr:hypothetical protein CAPTEDRAFT_189717 [Capitella teleta]|eukprot:ELT90766.1 hypothetical protein CAPTEDRAFT_189717 [Capitella teleta]
MDDWERSVVVGGVPGDVSEDHLQMYFENAHRSSGGRVESLRIDRTASAAVVTFTDPEAAERVKNRTHQLIGNSMYVMALNDSQGEQQLVLKVSGLPRGLDDSLIGYFENCPDGSSPIEAMHRVRGDCFVTFKNQRAYSGISSPDVEESILIMDEDFEYCYPGCLSDASERKVLVHAMNGVCDEELIHLLFSNKEKYNGGPIQEMTIAADLKTALITFCDKQEQVEFMGKVYKTSKPVLTTIKLSDVPACMTSDMLTVLLEENKGSSFSSCPDITIDRENREAIVTFGDASEADKIAECSKIVYASMKVEKVILPPVRDTQMSSPNEIDSCQQKENGVSPAKQVLVSGIEDNADEDFLRLLFTSKKKSGGGPIKDFSLRENGTALITYEEQRDAVDVLAHQNVVFMDRTYAVSRLGIQRDLEDEKVTKVLDQVKELVNAVTIECELSKVILLDKIQLDECWQKRVLNYHELANVSRLHPRVEIESARPESSIIFLRGCSDDIQRAKTYVENFLYAVPRRVLPVSVTTKTLLSGCESKDPILSRMNGRFVYWEASGEGHAVCIYALDEGDIDRWIAEIGHVIKEHKKNIDNILENDLRRVIANLEHRFPGRLSVLRNNNSELEFSVFWDVETDVLRMFNQLTRKDVGFNKKKLFYPK